MNGGIPVYYDLDGDFTIDWNLFKDCITEKDKSSHCQLSQNPTGKIWKKKTGISSMN